MSEKEKNYKRADNEDDKFEVVCSETNNGVEVNGTTNATFLTEDASTSTRRVCEDGILNDLVQKATDHMKKLQEHIEKNTDATPKFSDSFLNVLAQLQSIANPTVAVATDATTHEKNFFKLLFDVDKKCKLTKREGDRYIQYFPKAVELLLDRKDLGKQYTSNESLSENTFFLDLLLPKSKLREAIASLHFIRVPLAIPRLPLTVKESIQGVHKLTIASWNVGGCSLLDQAVFIVLMHLLKVDVIFVQERKTMDLKNLWKHEQYAELYFPPDTSAFKTRRGISIWYRKETLEGKIFNADGKIDKRCLHNSNYSKGGGGDAEYLWLDVKMTSGIRRLGTVYHTGGALECKWHIADSLMPARDMASLVMGDMNMARFIKVVDSSVHGGPKLNNVLHKEWVTNRKSETFTQPDVIYSNMEPKDLVVHKPKDPYDIVEFVIKNLDSSHDAVKEVLKRNKKYYAEKMKAVPPADKPVRKPTDYGYHFLLLAEVGDEVANGKVHSCTWDGINVKTNRVPQDHKFYCSQKECKFFERAFCELKTKKTKQS